MSFGDRVLKALSASKNIAVPHLDGSLRAHLAAELIRLGRLPILVARDEDDAEALFQDLLFFLGINEDTACSAGLLFLGSDGQSPYEEHSPDTRSVMERINTLYRLSKEPERTKAIVMSPGALLRRQVPLNYLRHTNEYVLTGADIERDRLLNFLTSTGYNAVNRVEDPGTFSVRGGIIDIFSPYLTKPMRLDMFGDTIDSIRLFDPTSQRTDTTIEDAIILPAREINYDADTRASAVKQIETLAEEVLIPTRKVRSMLEDVENGIFFFGVEALLPLFHQETLVATAEYLPKSAHSIVLHPGETLLEQLEKTWSEATHGEEHARAAHHICAKVAQHFTPPEESIRFIANSPAIALPDMLVGEQTTVASQHGTHQDLRQAMLKASRSDAESVLEPIAQRLKQWRSEGITTLLSCQTRGQAERLRELLASRKLQTKLLETSFSVEAFHRAQQNMRESRKSSILRDASYHALIAIGDISSGFIRKEDYLAVITEEEIFGRRLKKRRRRTPATNEYVSDLRDLKSGDYVVHVDYGIGLYQGLTKLTVNGVDSDFLQIEYKNNDKLYLPIDRLKLIQKYQSAEEGRKPQLDKLGTQTWANTKKKVKDTLLKMAAELLRLYAARATAEGFALSAPDLVFREFEAEFAFEPTPDQQKAIDDVLADLQKPTPMDRLVCGDVGYGKTEVAMRAAMLAVLSKKQVAVLVPTTVLATQHYNVFSERFANYAVKTAIVSRFQSNEEIKKTVEGLKSGQVDIVIGTHRILSQDIRFKELGLLVIDEEHRFGVGHKEKLKKLRTQVHVMTMSATPIPRTLHMGFMGVRDMSMITTPPVDRLAIKTEVHRFSEEIIRDAILSEIRRGGQCFVVHNRVSSIYAFAKMLERIVPEARVAVGHGQMDENRLEKVMVDFMNKDSNVLLSTTIIESGIDIPNANTIIINRADRLGLAQLYQLRGRVGRSKVRGYSYFLIPASNLTKQARQRIAVLQRFTELGAGFQVAAKDLEIRGAGNLLGQQQHGTIAQVGFEMYQHLLKEAIEELKGSGRSSLKDPEIQVPIPTLIPESYISPPGDRLSYYQRLSNADSDETTFNILQEMADLFGTPPAEVENLVKLMLVKQRMVRAGAMGLDYGAATKLMPSRLVFRFELEQPVLAPEQLVAFVNRRGKDRRLTPEGKLIVHLATFEDITEILQQAKDLLEELIQLRYRRL